MNDPLYLILVLPAVLFSLIASAKVNTTFAKYSKKLSHAGLTGAEAARRVLASHGIYDVQIKRTAGNLTDHYDPRDNCIYLSTSVFDNTSCAAIGVAAHEAGHAVQHAQNYAPVKLRTAIVPITNVGSRLSWPLILVGVILMALSDIFFYVAMVGVILFSLTALFQLITLPTEFNASRRAIATIEDCGLLDREEIAGAKKVLSAAAMTYVAALAVSLMQLLRVFLMVTGSRRR